MKWIKRWIHEKLLAQEIVNRRIAYGINDEEAELLHAIAKHNPYSIKELMDAYVTCNRSIDELRKVIYDARNYNFDLWDSMGLNTSPTSGLKNKP